MLSIPEALPKKRVEPAVFLLREAEGVVTSATNNLGVCGKTAEHDGVVAPVPPVTVESKRLRQR